MHKHYIACGEVVEGCPFHAEAETEEALLEKLRHHARLAHGVPEMTAELLAKVKEAIRTR